jgi:3-hydroxybutyryl-CoA dehydrogenase
MSERIAVVGAGLMGHGIAQVFAAAGHDVIVTDAVVETLGTVATRVAANLERLGADPLPVVARITTEASLEEALAGADFVVEAAPEDLDLKRDLFERMSRAAGPETILATNTSVMSVDVIGNLAHDPGRVVGTHFWNPPYLVPLVEVTQGEMTRPTTVSSTMALLERAGKAPIHVKRDIPGFIGNRLQHALWREAISLVEHGVCDAESVDAVVKTSFGLRLPVLGPLENADLVGLDMTLAIHDYVLPHLDSTPGPSPLLEQLVEAGDLGMKTGRGFRTWTPEESDAVRARLFDHLVSVAE